MELKPTQNEHEWNNFVKQQKQASLLQSWRWRNLLDKKKENPKTFFVLKKGDVVASVLVSKVNLPLNKYYLYCPRGPVFKDGFSSENREKVVKEIVEGLCSIEDYKEAIFLRLDPALPKQDINLHRAGLVKAGKEVQPRQTIIINLIPSEDDIMASMKSKTRYNIRLASKRGIEVVHGRGEQDLNKFYNLLEKTGERNDFSAHPKQHYINLWQTLFPDNLRLYLAEFKDQIIAGILVGSFDGKAVYLHGASDYKYRKHMAPHLLQWQAIKEAKQNNCSEYDLWGVAPKEAGSGHPWGGITRFKEGFGGRYEEYVGSYDYVYKPGWYRVFNIVRNLRSTTSS